MSVIDFTYSVIIPTYNRGKIALDTIKELEKQNFPEFQVIIVDQSPDPYPDLVNYDALNFSYKYIHIETPSLPNARNVGVGNCKSEYVVFLDDDCIPESDLIHKYAAVFTANDHKLALVGGRVIEQGSNIFRERANLVGGYVTRYGKTLKNFDTDASGECEWVPGGNFSVRRRVYLELGGFDINFIGTSVMEDSDFGYSVGHAGYKILYDPGPVMEHLRIPTGGLRQSDPACGMKYRAHNSVYFFRKYQLKRYLPLVGLYLCAVTLKEWIARSHSAWAFYYCGIGYIKGFTTPLRSR